ncbi:SRPBCC family protein [Haloarchaeobius sp. TZWWS8]|uniref:SRPBCC family protein n=1 Tax=Haloarchaeobius sp. TZWWS8 TaxID=3446121 RepID=UPI003EC00F86
MKRIETRIEIDAPVEAVWRVLTDLPNYATWNPFIPEASGTVAPGERLHVRIQPEGGRGMSFSPAVLAADENRLLQWRGRLLVPGLFDGTHSFELEPLDDGGTRLVQSEEFSGLLVPVLLDDSRIRDGFKSMNRALKERAEALSVVV